MLGQMIKLCLLITIIIWTEGGGLYIIYTIILLKSVCRSYQTGGRNSCSIVSGDVSNCSYRLKVLPLTSSLLSSPYKKCYYT